MLPDGEVSDRTHLEESVDLVGQLQYLEGVECQADVRQHDPSSVHLPRFSRGGANKARDERTLSAAEISVLYSSNTIIKGSTRTIHALL